MAVRFIDVLTTATAVANYIGAPVVTGEHVLAALDVLEEKRTVADLGRQVSPLLRRPSPAADPAVREFAQRWFARLGGDVTAEVEGELLDQLRQEAEGLSRPSAS